MGKEGKEGAKMTTLTSTGIWKGSQIFKSKQCSLATYRERREVHDVARKRGNGIVKSGKTTQGELGL